MFQIKLNDKNPYKTSIGAMSQSTSIFNIKTAKKPEKYQRSTLSPLYITKIIYSELISLQYTRSLVGQFDIKKSCKCVAK